MNRLCPLCLLGCLLAGVGLEAADWSQFRGGPSNGDAGNPGIPLEWSAVGTERNILWKTEIAGVGFSSPVVKGGKVFLTNCPKRIWSGWCSATTWKLAADCGAGPF